MNVYKLIQALRALGQPDAPVVVEGYGLYEGFYEETDGPEVVFIGEDGSLAGEGCGRLAVRLKQ